MIADVQVPLAPPMAWGPWLSFAAMMFFQFAIWGAWFPVLGNYLTQLAFTKDRIGAIYSTMALGTIFAPMIFGQLADVYFASQKLMGVLHLVGGCLLIVLARIRPPQLASDGAVDPDKTRTTSYVFFGVALLYAFAYSPTLALSNSVAFSHIPDATRDFPGIRVFGTIGWIVAGMLVGKVLVVFAADPKRTNLPLILAALFSFALGAYSFFLPDTPPKGQAGETLPFLRAFELLKETSFAVFFGVSFVITIVLAFYYGFTGIWLEKKIGVKDVASTMTIGQWSEMIILPFLPWFLSHLGMKWVLVVGMAAWGIRYAFFAFALPRKVRVGGFTFDPIILTLVLHGICFDFFFAAGFIHVDNTAPKEIKASAQALFAFLTYGLGMWIGNVASGFVAERFTDKATQTTDWKKFWLVPCVGVFASLAVFAIWFR